MIGTPGVERPLPQQPAARQVERGNVAEITARDIQRAAVGRDVSVLREVGSAWSDALGARGIDVDGADDGMRHHVDEGNSAAFGIGDDGHFHGGRRPRRLSSAAMKERRRRKDDDEGRKASEAISHGHLRYGR